MDINYEHFKLVFPKKLNLTFDEKASVYRELLDKYSSKSNVNNYEKLDKDFKEFKYTDAGKISGYILNWIDKTWWDYGYNKFLIIRNAIYLNIFFFFINVFIYEKLLHKAYRLEKFIEIEKELQDEHKSKKVGLIVAKLPYIFLYTSYIFWGWKLDMQSINIKNILLFGYVLLQYLVGIVCLAYLLNFIVTK